jgi:DNA-binding response OmpR family regulator
MIRDYLTQDGFEVQVAHDGEAGVREALSGHYAVAVVDVMMPKINGIEALRLIRRDSEMPIIMLTARGDDTDRIIGLELGADDYVPKPCTGRELSARIRAILKRVAKSNRTTKHSFQVGLLEFWPEKRQADWNGAKVDLTSTEFSLLEALVNHAGQIVSKETLSITALGRELNKFDRSIDAHMSSIRQKLGTLSDGKSCITTVIRKGYMLRKE